MLDLRSAVRRGGSLLAVAGCLAILLADSAEDTNACQATPIVAVYDLTLRCTIPPQTVSTYSGRVRFNGDLNQAIGGINESGDVEFFQVTQLGSCAADGAAATAGALRVTYIVDESGVLLPFTSTEPGSIPVNGQMATCEIQPGDLKKPVNCQATSAANACQATLTAVP